MPDMASADRRAAIILANTQGEGGRQVTPDPDNRKWDNGASQSDRSFQTLATRVPDCWISFAEATSYDAQVCFWGFYWHYLLLAGIAANARPLEHRSTSGPTITTHHPGPFSPLLECILIFPCLLGCFVWRLPSDANVQSYIARYWENPETVGDRSKPKHPRPFVSMSILQSGVGIGALLYSIAATATDFALVWILIIAAVPLVLLVPYLIILRYVPVLAFSVAYPCFLYIFFVVWHSSLDDVLAIEVSPAQLLKAVFRSPFVRSAAFVYVAMHIWIAMFDSIRVDDESAVARAGRHNARRRMGKEEMVFAVMVESIALAIAGKEAGLTGVWFVWGCGGACLVQAVMLARIELDDRQDCEWWFRRAGVLSGWCLVTGVVACYMNSFVLSAFDRNLTVNGYLNLALAVARGAHRR